MLRGVGVWGSGLQGFRGSSLSPIRDYSRDPNLSSLRRIGGLLIKALHFPDTPCKTF